MSHKKRAVKVRWIGNHYQPPLIKAIPVVKDRTARVQLATKLTPREEVIIRSVFDSCLRQRGLTALRLKMKIEYCAITIFHAADNVLWEVLDYLGFDKPVEASTQSDEKPPTVKEPKSEALAHPRGPARHAIS